MTHFANSVAFESSHKDDELLKRTKRFLNRRAAGHELAVRLQMYRTRTDSIVIGIAPGGVPVAHEIASICDCRSIWC